MPESSELIQAAREFGAALNETPEVQALLQAQQAFESDAEVQQLAARVDEVYNSLVSRQQAGEMLFPYEVNEFYKLRDQFVFHPVVAKREEALRSVKALFEQAGSAISSILSVDYTALVVE